MESTEGDIVEKSDASAPLAGIKVVELAGVGPCPFAGMLLSQLGAQVLRIERFSGSEDFLGIPPGFHFMNRGKARLDLDLKNPVAVSRALEIISRADVLIEGFRPGVMERLGLGPHACHSLNPDLIYGRVTGWGQTGPMCKDAGHDITYLALSGVLHSIGSRDGAPVPPLNLLGDFAGGALYLVIGILAALHRTGSSRQRQVIDAAMLDGVVHLSSFIFGLRQAGMWNLERGANSADGGFPFYAVYATSDGKWIAVAAVEERFRRAFVDGIGLDPALTARAVDPQHWDEVRAGIANIIRTRGRDDWVSALSGLDACVAPVLDLDEARSHPHLVERQLFDHVDGTEVPTLAPKLSPPFEISATPESDTMLRTWGL
jgi:alpha-methylacyl-CoA racemase